MRCINRLFTYLLTYLLTYAEDNSTESNCTNIVRTGKSETKVTNNKKTVLEVLYY